MDLLGNIVWYMVSSGEADAPLPVTRADLEKTFAELDLSVDFLPPPPKGVDAFRTASGMIDDTYTAGTEQVKLSAQEVRKSDTSVTRHVIRTGTDVHTGKVRANKVAELLFTRPKRRNVGRDHGTETIEVYPHRDLDGVDRAMVGAALDQFEHRYELFRQRLTPAAVRYMIRNYLIWLDAVPIPAGQNWFLPNERTKEVEALRELTQRLGPHCAFDIIPLLDTPELRAMLLGNVECALAGQVVAVRKTIVDWVAANGEPIPVMRYNAWRKEIKGIQARADEYGRLLEAPLPRSSDAIAQAVDALRGLELAHEVR